jgi:hypothetical protein
MLDFEVRCGRLVYRVTAFDYLMVYDWATRKFSGKTFEITRLEN